VSSHVLVLVVDDQPIDTITAPLQETGMTVTIARDAADALQRLQDQQLIILVAKDTASVALLCRRINDEAGSSHPPILAVADNRDVEARVRLLEAGADDVLAQPIDRRELDALVEALLLRSAAATRVTGGTTQQQPRPQGAPGRLIVFAAAKGGSGTTSLAVNTAVVLAEMAPGNVAIADFDMYHGQVSTHLDIYARSSTAALAREERLSQTPELIAEAGKLHSSGLTVFGAPYRPDDAVDVTPDQMVALVETLRRSFGTLIVDVGSTLDARSVAVLQRADRLAMVVTPDIPALRVLHACMQMLSEHGNAIERSIYIVNQIYARPMIGPEQIEDHLGIKVGLEIPYDGENFAKAANEGRPLVMLAHRSAPAAALRRLASQLTDGALDEAPAQPRKRGLLGGLLGRD
jgi:pilus assembly protein CpaE